MYQYRNNAAQTLSHARYLVACYKDAKRRNLSAHTSRFYLAAAIRCTRILDDLARKYINSTESIVFAFAADRIRQRIDGVSRPWLED